MYARYKLKNNFFNLLRVRLVGAIPLRNDVLSYRRTDLIFDRNLYGKVLRRVQLR